MLLAYIWIGFLTIAILLGLIRIFVLPEMSTLFNLNTIPEMIPELCHALPTAFVLALNLSSLFILCLGIVKIAKNRVLIAHLTNVISRSFSNLVPEITYDHLVIGEIYYYMYFRWVK